MKKKLLVIYDGDCGFCQKSLSVLQKLDWCQSFQYRPLQDQKIYEEYSLLKYEKCLQELKLVYSPQKIRSGADAIIFLSLRLPLITLFALLFTLPGLRHFARWLYPKIANNRHRISAALNLGTACKIGPK